MEMVDLGRGGWGTQRSAEVMWGYRVGKILPGHLFRVHGTVCVSQSIEYTSQRTSPNVNQTFTDECIHTGSSFVADATLTQLLKAREMLSQIGAENICTSFCYFLTKCLKT